MGEEYKIVELIKIRARQGAKVEIKISKDGVRHKREIDNVVYFEVLPEEYEIAVAEYDKIMEKKEEITRVNNMSGEERIDKEVETIVNSKKRNRTIINKITDANQLPVRVYVDTVKNNINTNNLDKRDIKGKRTTIGKGKISKKLIAAILAAGIAVGATAAITVDKINERIEETQNNNEEKFENALVTLKNGIAKSAGTEPENIKVLNKSSYLSSSTFATYYTVEIDGEIYKFYEKIDCNDGHVMERQDEIMNSDLIEAIGVITNAQGGNSKQCNAADEMARKIEKGEINVSMRHAIGIRAQENFDKIPTEDLLR